ncbi:hypothetical protein SipoB123_02240 [Streptomyces ipomoeae]|nr:hypothetical protein SipoB123_02240 [Streptomyces ipomoeae]
MRKTPEEVSRLLKKAQDRGIVRITVTPPSGTYPELDDGLRERYGLKLALVVDTAPENERTMLGDLGAAAAYYPQTTLRSGDTVGISSWSASLPATVQATQPVAGLKDVRIVQAVGGIGDPAVAGHASRMTGQPAQLVSGEAVYLQAPGVGRVRGERGGAARGPVRVGGAGRARRSGRGAGGHRRDHPVQHARPQRQRLLRRGARRSGAVGCGR